jgi:hypothetical protein
MNNMKANEILIWEGDKLIYHEDRDNKILFIDDEYLEESDDGTQNREARLEMTIHF